MHIHCFSESNVSSKSNLQQTQQITFSTVALFINILNWTRDAFFFFQLQLDI